MVMREQAPVDAASSAARMALLLFGASLVLPEDSDSTFTRGVAGMHCPRGADTHEATRKTGSLIAIQGRAAAHCRAALHCSSPCNAGAMRQVATLHRRAEDAGGDVEAPR